MDLYVIINRKIWLYGFQLYLVHSFSIERFQTSKLIFIFGCSIIDVESLDGTYCTLIHQKLNRIYVQFTCNIWFKSHPLNKISPRKAFCHNKSTFTYEMKKWLAFVPNSCTLSSQFCGQILTKLCSHFTLQLASFSTSFR